MQLSILRATLLIRISIKPSWRKVHLSSHTDYNISVNEFTKIIPLQVAHFLPKSSLVIALRLLRSVEKFLIEEKYTNSKS